MALTYLDEEPKHGLTYVEDAPKSGLTYLDDPAPQNATPEQAQASLEAVRQTNLALTTTPGGMIGQAYLGGLRGNEFPRSPVSRFYEALGFPQVYTESKTPYSDAAAYMSGQMPEHDESKNVYISKFQDSLSALTPDFVGRVPRPVEIQSWMNKLKSSDWWAGKHDPNTEPPVIKEPEVGAIANMTAGVQRSAAKTLGFFTSPEGIALLGTSALHPDVQHAVAAAFAIQMATQAPDQVVSLAQSKNLTEATERATDLLTTSGLFTLASAHMARDTAVRSQVDTALADATKEPDQIISRTQPKEGEPALETKTKTETKIEAEGQIPLSQQPLAVPSPETPPAAIAPEALPKGSVVRSKKYGTEGDIEITGEPQIVDGRTVYPSLFVERGQPGTIAAEHIDQIVSKPAQVPLASLREAEFNKAHPETNTETNPTHFAAAVSHAAENNGVQFFRNGEPSAFVVHSMEEGRPAWKLVEPFAEPVRGHDGILHSPEIGFATQEEAIASALKRGFEVDPETLSEYEKTRGQSAARISEQTAREQQPEPSKEPGAPLQAEATGGAGQAGKRVRISIPDSPTGVPDLIDFVKEQGGIKLPRKGERTQEHDDVSEETEAFYNGKLVGTRGKISADEMAQMAADAGLIKSPTPPELWRALHENIVGRPRTREMAREMQRKMVEAEKESRRKTTEALEPERVTIPIDARTSKPSDGTFFDEYLNLTLARGWRKMGDFYEYSTTLGGGGKHSVKGIAKALDVVHTKRGMNAVVGIPIYGMGKAIMTLKEKGLWDAQEQSAPPQKASVLPTLRSGEKQGDLLSKQTEDLALVGEKGVDYVAREAERVASEKASAEARAAQEKQQTKLFEKPSTETPPTLTKADVDAQGARIDAIVQKAVESGKDRIEAENEAHRIVDSANHAGVSPNWGDVESWVVSKESTQKRGGEKTLSTEQPASAEGEQTLGETIASEATTPEDESERADVNKAVEGLKNPQHKQVVDGLMSGKSDTEIAAEMGVSKQRVGDIKKAAFAKLRAAMKDDPRGVLSLQIIPGIHEFIQKDIARVVSDGLSGAVRAIREVAQVLSPPTRGLGARRIAGNIRERAAELARKYEVISTQLKGAAKLFNSTSKVFNVGVIDDLETGKPMATPGLQTFGNTIRKAFDERVKEVQALNPNALQHLITDYFPHIWTKESIAKLQNNPNPLTGNAWAAAFGKRPLEGGKAFLKQRSIPTTADGIAAGLEPVTYNPVELTLLKLREMDRYIMGQKVIGEMKDTGQLKFVRAGVRPDPGYTKIDDRFAKVFAPRDWQVTDAAGNRMPGQVVLGEYYAPDDVARVLNNHLSPGLRGNATYDAFRWVGNVMNQAQLGLSFYHGTFTMLDAMTSSLSLGIEQIARGNPVKGLANIIKSLAGSSVGYGAFENFFRGNNVLREYVKPGSVGGDFGQIVDALVAGGGRARMDTFYRTGAFNSMMNAIHEGNYPGAVLRAPFAAIEAMAKPLMEHIVPRMKLGIFADMARYELEKLPATATPDEVRAVMGRVWNSVDNRMGQLVYDNLFWHRTLKDSLMASVRSVGWNLGTISEVGGGAVDLATLPARAVRAIKGTATLENKPVITHKMPYLIALPIMTAWVGGMLYYLMTGQRPQSIEDLFMPKTGRKKNDGTDERVLLPTYMKDVTVLGVAAAHRGVIGLASRTAQMALNKAHPLISTMSQMFQNKDYYGNQIRNGDDGLVKSVEKEAMFVAKNFLSFSVRGAMEREGGAKEKAQTFFGIMPVPKELTRTKAMQAMSDYFASKAPQGGRTEADQIRKQTLDKIESEVHGGANMEDVLTKYQNRGEMTSRQESLLRSKLTEDPRVYLFKRLPKDEAKRVFEKGTDEEKALWKDALESKESGASGGGIAPSRSRARTIIR